MSEECVKTAIVLGGTAPHGELIKELKKRGYRTVLIDYFDDPPAAKFADRHYKDSAMDFDAVLRIAKKENAEVILSSCLDQQMNIAMKVAEALDLKRPFSSEMAAIVTNKRLMKRIMIDNGIPTAKFAVVDKQSDLNELHFDSMIIVKPDASSGSAGVAKIMWCPENMDQIRAAVDKACTFGLTGKAIIEEFIQGSEMSIHGYVKDGKARLLFGTCRTCAISERMNKLLYNLYLPKLKDSLEEKLQKIADQIIAVFELPDQVPLFLQVIVRDDDVYVLEFSPRLAGGISTFVAKEYADFDFFSLSIDSYLGNQHDFEEDASLKKYVCCLPMYAREGYFRKLENIDALLADGTIRSYVLLKNEGEKVNVNKPSSSLVVKYILDADSAEECYEKIMKVNAEADILDTDGSSMKLDSPELTHDLYLQTLNKIA